MLLLLDTHVLIWLTEQTGQANQAIREQIDRSAREEGVLVSPITFWEVGLLTSGGRLRLETSIDNWLERVIGTPGLGVAPFTPAIAIESTRLPGEFHRDPSDRFIVATARALDATLVTHDRDILRYAQDGHLKALAA